MKFLKLLLLLALVLAAANAQAVFVPGDGGPVNSTLSSVNPAGSCGASAQVYNYVSGHTWACVGAPGSQAWTDISGAPLRSLSGNTVCGFGDSIIGAGATDVYWAPTWFNVLMVLSNGQMQFVHQAGVSGNTTAQMLARLRTDVLNQSCAKVIMDGGTNDILGSLSLPAAEANLLSMYQQIKANGQLPIVMTLPPHTGAFYSQTSTLNAWIKQTAYRLNIPLIDVYGLTVDPATGDYKAGYSSDGTHPFGAALRIIATKALSDLQAVFPASHHPLLPFVNTDANNLLSNGLLLNSSSGIATGWSTINVSGHVTYSISTDASVPSGNVQVVTKATTSAGDNDGIASPNVTTGFAAGDRIAFVGKLVTSGLEAGLGTVPPAVNVFFYTAGFALSGPFLAPWTLWQCDIASGQWYMEATVPAGTAIISIQFNVGNGTGVFKYGQLGIYDLTQMGL